MAEDHGAPEAGKLPGTEIVKRQKTANERATQRVRSCTVQNEMRGILGRVSASTAGRILDSANSREIRSLTEDCVRCSEGEREHSKQDVEAQVPRLKSREPVCQRIRMRQYASSPRKERSGYQR